ncbi:hypothetical protein BLNAU_22492 [Blattamonas nauphoetae]|uniref:Uncharacterized protein n=1 Tax=Blattamonas nauphoetae TaxID=2049346 RepID=A0ABQ9WTF0_9EUKA|nr:hypothetical protein BLNAU_22492 [Blattamonas nauphoetae]
MQKIVMMTFGTKEMTPRIIFPRLKTTQRARQPYLCVYKIRSVSIHTPVWPVAAPYVDASNLDDMATVFSCGHPQRVSGEELLKISDLVRIAGCGRESLFFG